MLCMWHSGEWGDGALLEASFSHHNVPCSVDRVLPFAQVHQARTEARAEAEAAAEQRVAALDQARCEEREAAVREALALGALPVRTPWPQAKGPMLHSGQRSRRPCLV